MHGPARKFVHGGGMACARVYMLSASPASAALSTEAMSSTPLAPSCAVTGIAQYEAITTIVKTDGRTRHRFFIATPLIEDRQD
jgi:hypothetical protein